MKFKGFLLNISFLWVEGMAFFPFIFLRHKNPGSFLLNHEQIHLRQQLEMGLVLFYIWYFVEYLVRLVQYGKHEPAYYGISFEKEAYLHQHDIEYLKKRGFWAFRRYL